MQYLANENKHKLALNIFISHLLTLELGELDLKITFHISYSRCYQMNLFLNNRYSLLPILASSNDHQEQVVLEFWVVLTSVLRKHPRCQTEKINKKLFNINGINQKIIHILTTSKSVFF